MRPQGEFSVITVFSMRPWVNFRVRYFYFCFSTTPFEFPISLHPALDHNNPDIDSCSDDDDVTVDVCDWEHVSAHLPDASQFPLELTPSQLTSQVWNTCTRLTRPVPIHVVHVFVLWKSKLLEIVYFYKSSAENFPVYRFFLSRTEICAYPNLPGQHSQGHPSRYMENTRFYSYLKLHVFAGCTGLCGC